jgi:hypothetical protein
MDAGLITLTRQPLDVFPLVADVAANVHESADREVRLEVRGEDGGAQLLGDGQRLTTAFGAIFQDGCYRRGRTGVRTGSIRSSPCAVR